VQALLARAGDGRPQVETAHVRGIAKHQVCGVGEQPMLMTRDEVGVGDIELGDHARFGGVQAGFIRPRCNRLSHQAVQSALDPRQNRRVQVWERFLAGLDPLRHAGKLGAILLQFPPWLPISRAGKDYIVASAERAAPDRVCIEFRNRTWMTPENQDEAGHRLPYVCADMPQGHRDSIPPVLAATARAGRGPPARPLQQVGQPRHP
jgi:hypothetical protein